MAEPTSAPTQAQTELPAGSGRAIVIGSMIGFLVVGTFTGVTAFAFGASFLEALGLAAFTGLWGGPGFGGMMGFVLHDAKTNPEHS